MACMCALLLPALQVEMPRGGIPRQLHQGQETDAQYPFSATPPFR